MKIKLRYPLILGVLLALLLVNATPVLLLPEKAALTNFSVFPGAIAILMIIYGLCALIDKHKGNYFQLSDPRGRSLSYNKSYTYKEPYEREFRLSMLIYFGAVPFYIPLIFFARSYPAATFGTFAVMLVPQIFLAIPMVREAIQDSKERKRILAERERERIEQERREERGEGK
jgi:hypothetical protein